MAVQGMVFVLDPHGNPQAQASLNNPEAPFNDSPPTGDWVVTVTGCPANTSQQTVAALLKGCSVPIPFTSGRIPNVIRFTITYASLQAGGILQPW